MREIIKNIKREPNDLILMSVIALLYSLNNCFLKKAFSGIPGEFFKCYFNDLMAPCFLLAYSNMLLSLKGKRINKIMFILPFCLCAGLIWEYFTPLIKKSSVTDPFDILAYLIGGSIYFVLEKVRDMKPEFRIFNKHNKN